MDTGHEYDTTRRRDRSLKYRIRGHGGMTLRVYLLYYISKSIVIEMSCIKVKQNTK